MRSTNKRHMAEGTRDREYAMNSASKQVARLGLAGSSPQEVCQSEGDLGIGVSVAQRALASAGP